MLGNIWRCCGRSLKPVGLSLCLYHVVDIPELTIVASLGVISLKEAFLAYKSGPFYRVRDNVVKSSEVVSTLVA